MWIVVVIFWNKYSGDPNFRHLNIGHTTKTLLNFSSQITKVKVFADLGPALLNKSFFGSRILIGLQKKINLLEIGKETIKTFKTINFSTLHLVKLI